MKVGFIGLGDMGLPMAQRIQSQGHDLVLWARREASLALFSGTGATVTASPAGLGRLVDCVGICVFGARDVEDVLFGAHGVAETLRPGAVIMMHSTVSAGEAQALAGKSAARWLRLLDAGRHLAFRGRGGAAQGHQAHPRGTRRGTRPGAARDRRSLRRGHGGGGAGPGRAG